MAQRDICHAYAKGASHPTQSLRTTCGAPRNPSASLRALSTAGILAASMLASAWTAQATGAHEGLWESRSGAAPARPDSRAQGRASLRGEGLRRGGATFAERLESLPGVGAQQTNRGASTVMLRGQVGPSVLLLLDGLRLNQGFFRTGPSQYIESLDPFLLDRVDVIAGSESATLGADAIGGAVHARSPRPRYGAGVWALGEHRFESADEARVHHVQAGASDAVSTLRLGATLADHGLLRTGGGSVSPASDYRRYAALAEVSLLPGARIELVLRYYEGGVLGAGRTDQLYRNQMRRADTRLRLLLLELDHIGEGALETLQVRLGRVAWEEEETRGLCRRGDRDGFTPARLVTLDPEACAALEPTGLTRRERRRDATAALGASADLRLRFATPLALEVGAEGWTNTVHTSATQEAPTHSGWGPAASLAPTLPDGARWGTVGGYTALAPHAQVSEALRLWGHAGLRGQGFFSSAEGVPYIGPIDHATWGLAASTRAALTWRESVDVYVGWGQGLRAPNLQESVALGNTGSFFEVPNPRLRAERSESVEGGVHALLVEGTTAAARMFALWTRDTIVRESATWRGVEEVEGTPVAQRINAGEGRWWGWEASVQSTLAQGTSLEGGAAWMRGDEERDEGWVPARRVPPLRWGVAAGHRVAPLRLHGRIGAEGAVAQRRLHPDDRRDLRICERREFPGLLEEELGARCGGTPGWWTLHARVTLEPWENVAVYLHAENLLDRQYRQHGSGVDAPGSSWLLGIRWAAASAP